MKQSLILLSIVAVVCLSSCTTTYSVTSKSTLDRGIDQVAIELQKKGYYPVGSSTDTKNEVTVTGQSYSEYSGYSTRMDNNYITSDTYRFADTLGNTMSYTVSYQLREKSGFYFVNNLQVKGCETSSVKEYGRLCGAESPTKIVSTLPTDASVKLYDETKTYLMLGGILLLLCIPVVAMSGAE